MVERVGSRWLHEQERTGRPDTVHVLKNRTGLPN